MKGLAKANDVEVDSRNEISRMQRVDLQIRQVRKIRGVQDTWVGASADPFVLRMVERVYGLDLLDLDLTAPAKAREKLLSRLQRPLPRRTGIEVTVIAPGLKAHEFGLQEMGERGVKFHLINAELRRTEGSGLTTRAIVRWEELHRTRSGRKTAPSEVIRFQSLLSERNQDAASFRWKPFYRSDMGGTQLYWGTPSFWYLRIDPDRNEIKTMSGWLTEGLRDLGPKRKAALRSLANELQKFGVERQGDALVAPVGS